MTANYSLDTSTVIEILRGNENVMHKLKQITQTKSSLFICSVVYYEIMRGFGKLQTSKRMQSFAALYDRVHHLPFCNLSVKKAIEIYVNLPRGITLEDADIFIAATAMVNNCILVTANIKHFSLIEELKTVNWRE